LILTYRKKGKKVVNLVNFKKILRQIQDLTDQGIQDA